jgi:23S rRNA (uracil747-C5)-methyltransferase
MNTFCSSFNQGLCHSCDLITRPGLEQLSLKEEKLNSLFPLTLLPSVTGATSSFRNKAKFVITGTMENPVIGLYGEEKLDQGRSLLNCPLHVKTINDSLPIISEFITLAKLPPYEIHSQKGELKGIILFYSHTTHEGYLRFILRSKEAISRIKKHLPWLQEKLPHLLCMSANLQPIPHAILEGEEELYLTEKNFILHKTGDFLMRLTPKAFVQTNQVIAEKLYSTAASWIKEAGISRFLELFCGQGAFSFFAAHFIDAGLGIELNSEAIQTAQASARDLHLTKLTFKSSDASSVLQDVIQFHPDLILVNPPRGGLKGVIAILNSVKPKSIIYSSCNHLTLSQDLKLMPSYEIKKIQLFDMFPHTSHFETLVFLETISEGG